jgi:hypothetical protein
VPIIAVMVANPQNIGHYCHMESTSEHNPSLLIESTSKHYPLLGRAYEWFLEWPVPFVLAVMWLIGVALVSVCGLGLYVSLYYVWLSLQTVVGG